MGHYCRPTLRTLLVTQALPHPPRGGNELRVWQNVVTLLGVGPVGVFGLRADEQAPPPRDGIEVWRSSRDRSLTDPRTASSLDWMKDPAAVPWDQYYSPTAASEIREVLENFEPDIVVLEHCLYRYIDVVKDHGAALVVDCHQLESAYNRDLAAAAPSRVARLVRAELAERTAAVEARAFAVADQVWACSPSELERIVQTCPASAPVAVVPNTVDVASYDTRPDGQYHTLMLPAMWAYPPNEAAGLMLVNEILPPLGERFLDLRLTLVGRNPTRPLVEAAEGDPRVTVTGAVADVRPHLAEAGAMPVPVFSGGGTRFKVLEAFAARVPVASTNKGVEGIDAVDGRHYLGADDTPTFVEAVTRLWSDPKATAALVDRAMELVREQYSWEAAGRAVAVALDRIPR